jgi:hypothetical protein
VYDLANAVQIEAARGQYRGGVSIETAIHADVAVAGVAVVDAVADIAAAAVVARS